MDILTFLLIVVILYFVLLFFDVFFKSCAHYPYIQFLKGTGLHIRPFCIQWNTTAFNRLLVKWGCSHVKFLNIWFTLGLYVTLILLPIAVFLIFYAIIQIFSSNVQDVDLIVEPVLPGVNLPLSELGYYSFTLICCSIVHEIGHALSAVNEDVHVINVGVNILFIIPIAYVNINTEKLQSSNPWKILRILCAGVWHNLVLSFFAYIIYLLVPIVLPILFSVDKGMYVRAIETNSPLLGPKGLVRGDIITEINNCDVTDESSWTECLLQMRTHKRGLCVDSDIVQALDESVPLRQLTDGSYDCCGQTKQDWLCFEYIDNNNGIVALPPHTCLPARKITDSFSKFCTNDKHFCRDGFYCIMPLLSNSTTLLVLKRINRPNIIYIGHPMDVMYSVQISPFIPKYLFTSTIVPDTLMKLLRYIVLFSLGLALVNVVPCAYMDGQHITHVLTQLTFKDQRQKVSIISTFITLCGTSILIFQCIYTVWTRLFK